MPRNHLPRVVEEEEKGVVVAEEEVEEVVGVVDLLSLQDLRSSQARLQNVVNHLILVVLLVVMHHPRRL